MFKPMSSSFVIFINYDYGFRKGFSTQKCFIALLENWQRYLELMFLMLYYPPDTTEVN